MALFLIWLAEFLRMVEVFIPDQVIPPPAVEEEDIPPLFKESEEHYLGKLNLIFSKGLLITDDTSKIGNMWTKKFLKWLGKPSQIPSSGFCWLNPYLYSTRSELTYYR